MTPIPSPQSLGLPAKFKSWRAHQEDAIRLIDTSGKPVVGLMLPPGAGKSAIYMAWAIWRRKRVMILTPNKMLQDQLYADFKGVGILDLRGQANYKCEISGGTVDAAPCHGGYECPIKGSCTYFSNLKRAPSEQFLLSNPFFWMHNKAILGEFDALVCDEGHSYFDSIARHISITFSKREVKEWFHQPPRRDWKPWASYQRSLLTDHLRRLKEVRVKDDAHWEEVRLIKRAHEKLTYLCDADVRSLIYQETMRGWTWDCVWPGAYRHLLTRGAKKYIFTSGTMTRRTLGMLGYAKDEFTWAEFPSTFPVSRCPVHILPTPRLNYHSSASSLRLWLEMMDSYMDKRADRRGLIHTGSYARSEYIATHSRHKERMIYHTDSRGLREAMSRFLSTPNAILISPAITEGVDFPYDKARFQIIAKLPFVNPSDPVEAERKRQDAQYPWYTAAMKVMQARGRVMRVEDDFGETAIADGAWQEWYFKPNRHHFTSYFCDALVELMVAPKAEAIPEARLTKTPANTASNEDRASRVKSLDKRVCVSALSVPRTSLFKATAPTKKKKE